MINCVPLFRRLRWPLLLGGDTANRVSAGQSSYDQKDQALAKLRKQNTQLVEAYATLTELVGSHLRSELDRRSLAAMPNS